MPADSGAFAQFDGVELVIEGGSLVSATIGGAPIDDARSYTLVVNSFMAGGGDTYPNLQGHPGFVDTGDPVSSAFIAFFEGHQPVRAADWAPTDVVRR
jgi:5'-nucleotidase/UDP-sugar diphosphatase